MTRLIAAGVRKSAEHAPRCFTLGCGFILYDFQWICPGPSCEKLDGFCFECYVLHVKTAHDKELH